jgi:hypothetical protein
LGSYTYHYIFPVTPCRRRFARCGNTACIGRTWHSSFTLCLAFRGSCIQTSSSTPVFTLARFFTRFITAARRIFHRRRNITSSTRTPQNTPERTRTPTPILFVPPPPSVIESFTSTHVATEGALSDSDTVIEEESIFEPAPPRPPFTLPFQVEDPPRNLLETLVQAIYFLGEPFIEQLHIQFGQELVSDSQFTVEDLVLFASEIVPVLTLPPTPTWEPIAITPRASVASLNQSVEEGQAESSSSRRSAPSL